MTSATVDDKWKPSLTVQHNDDNDFFDMTVGHSSDMIDLTSWLTWLWQHIDGERSDMIDLTMTAM